MTTFVPTADSYIDDLGQLWPNSTAARDAARRTVAERARDADDARLILTALGLLEDA